MQHKQHIDKILDRPEIENIKNDFRSIKANGSSLAKDLKHEGSTLVQEGLEHLKNSGSTTLRRAEENMRGLSGKTLAAGLMAGLVLGYLCRK